MTYIRVRLASFLGSKVSRLRSKTAEKENLLWAGDLGRVTILSDFVFIWSRITFQTTLEGPFHFFRVFGLKYKLQHGIFPLLTIKGSLYFQIYQSNAIPRLATGQATILICATAGTSILQTNAPPQANKPHTPTHQITNH